MNWLLGLSTVMAVAFAPIVDAAPASAEDADASVTVDEILDRPLEDDAYRQHTSCIVANQIEVVDVLNDETLVFRGRRTTWINRLPKRCPGLRKDMMITMQVRSYRLCAKQWFRGMERGRLQIPSSMCALGMFDEVNAAHIDRISQALEARRRTTTVARTLER